VKRIYGYLRASTDRQDASVPAQRQAIVEFAQHENLEVADWFTDDGVSGKTFDRPGYRRMRALILGGNPDGVEHIVVWSLSRFSRVAPDDFIAEKRELARAGVRIISATEPIRGEGTMADGLLGYISAYQNREFLVRLSTDVRRGMKALVQNGFWPSVGPLGYARQVVDNNRQPVIVNGQPLVLKRGQLKGDQNHVVLIPGDPGEQDAVRFMFQKRAYERWGLRRIAAALNAAGHHTINGQPWKTTTVRSCLTNVTYIGHTRYGVRRKLAGVRNQIEGTKLQRNPVSEIVVVENTHEALIPAELFERVQQTFRKSGGRSKRVGCGQRRLMLFSSAITCKHCGAHYQCRPRNKCGRTYYYYECCGRGQGRTDARCDSWCINVEKLKKFIFGEIQRRVSTDEFRTALRAYLVGRLGQLLRSEVLDTRRIDRDIALAQQKKRRLIDGIAEGVLDRHDQLVVQKLAEIDDELLVLTTQREEIVRVVGSDLDADAIAATLLERVNDLAGFLESQDVETQRKALFAFCRRIMADAQRREIVVETDLLGLAQNETPPGLPAGLCISNLPE